VSLMELALETNPPTQPILPTANEPLLAKTKRSPTSDPEGSVG
jgi:hypothetical protein